MVVAVSLEIISQVPIRGRVVTDVDYVWAQCNGFVKFPAGGADAYRSDLFAIGFNADSALKLMNEVSCLLECGFGVVDESCVIYEGSCCDVKIMVFWVLKEWIL